jgi:hypothetical protein
MKIEFHRFIGELAVTLGVPLFAEFSAKQGSDFSARLSNAVLVTTRLLTLRTCRGHHG